MHGDGHHIEHVLALGETPAPEAPDALAVLARIAVAMEAQAEVAAQQLAATRALTSAVERLTVLSALGPDVAGDMVMLDAKQVMSVMAIGETKLRELVNAGLIPMRRDGASSKRRIAASTLAEALRAMAR